MSDPALFPRVKRGRVPLPTVGALVYVPSSMIAPVRYGGLAKVTFVERRAPIGASKLRIEEHPDVTYEWRDLYAKQIDLWTQFEATVARMATPEEAQKILDEQSAKRAREVAQAAEAKARAEETLRKKYAPLKLPCLNRALLKVPIWNDHKRARNWAAIVTLDPTVAGGIVRFWLARGPGEVPYILPDTIKVNDVVEFGADKIRFASALRDKERWYGVVLEVSPLHLLLKPCEDAISAFRYAAEIAAPIPKAGP